MTDVLSEDSSIDVLPQVDRDLELNGERTRGFCSKEMNIIIAKVSIQRVIVFCIEVCDMIRAYRLTVTSTNMQGCMNNVISCLLYWSL